MDDQMHNAANGKPVEGEDVHAEISQEKAETAAMTTTTTTTPSPPHPSPASAPPRSTTSNLSATLQSLTDRALHFLSHSSNETLGACLVGLGASTYFIFGRVGLVFIGVAGGVVLHATWDGIRGDDRDEATKQAEKERRREAGIEVVRRILSQRSSQQDPPTAETKVYATPTLSPSFTPTFPPLTAAALTHFTDSVINDYVYWWYAPQLPAEENFPTSCRRTLVAFILSLSAHLHRKRPADAFLDFLTNASSILIVFLNELAAATNASPHSTPALAIETYLDLKPDSSLAYLLDDKAQEEKLQEKAEDILQAYLDPKAYNCLPVQVFLREVLARIVLGWTVQMCARPEWISEWIVYLLEESATAKEVMEIVDAGVEGREEVGKGKDVEREKEREVQREKEKEVQVEHKRKVSAAEEAMDEAMREAKRLTQMMIEEDERRAREETEGKASVKEEDAEDAIISRGLATPTSSQSERERGVGEGEEQEADATANPWTAVESPTSANRPSTPNTSNTQQQQAFTSFDQIIPPAQPIPLSTPHPTHTPTPLTLHNATISILDDTLPTDRASSTLKAKPTTDYLIQIEPTPSSSAPGWMIARKYGDFETLHEVLRRISVITGVTGFVESHNDLPRWKGNSKAVLRTELERYLVDAVRFQPLAESEGMKRFLEKEKGISSSSGAGGAGAGGIAGGANAAGAAFGKLGGDVFNVLNKTSKQGSKAVLGGGKAVLGGVAGLVGGATAAAGSAAAGATGGRRGNLSRSGTSSTTAIGDSSFSSFTTAHRSQASTATLEGYAGANAAAAARQSQDSLRAVPSPSSSQSPIPPQLARHVSSSSVASLSTSTTDLSKTRPLSQSSLELSRPDVTSSPSTNGFATPSRESVDDAGAAAAGKQLPPPPSEMPEDYPSSALPRAVAREEDAAPPTPPPRPTATTTTKPPTIPSKKPPLTDPETAVAVELLFAIITELYTLSSAWNFRRTLLSAAKTFLLRPGNPQLVAIRELLQSSLLDANLSDEGLAGHVYKLRENALPTEEEMVVWRRDFPEKSEAEKEVLRLKARELLVKKGMPAALTGVMGASATGEALGRVFDCLQVERVSKGLVYGLLVQAVKVVTD